MKFPSVVRILPLALAGACMTHTNVTTTPKQSREYVAIDSTVRRIFALGVAPGMGVVVVRDGSVVYDNGLGYADAESGRPFTPSTEFYIASATKSFTGLAAALLDDEGRMRLDAPLSEYLPSVRLHAPLSADSITMLSLLTHTHGIGADGPVSTRLAYTGDYRDDAQLAKLLAAHKPAAHGREYRYSNIGYNVATLAMDAVTGESWRQTLDTRIFRPLGMHNTSTYVSAFPAAQYAMPYVMTPTGFERVRFGKFDDNMQSAGGIVSTPADMGRWLIANINDGRIDGHQVIPASAFALAHRNYLKLDMPSHGLRQIGYALGWQVLEAGRDTILAHDGSFGDFATHMSFSPARRIGVVVMVNNAEAGQMAMDVVAHAIYDAMASGTPISTDSVEVISRNIDAGRARFAADLARQAARPQNLPLPLAGYTGTYVNQDWGKLVISLEKGQLHARMGRAESDVKAYDAAKNLLRLALFGNGTVVTPAVTDGRVVSLEMDGVIYTRVP